MGQVNWTGNKKKLRKVLKLVYPNPTKLAIFFSDEFNRNLNDITSSDDDLDARAYKLIESADAEGWLDELYEKFIAENLDHPNVKKFCSELEDDSLFPNPDNCDISNEDWERIFSAFTQLESDMSSLKIAVHEAFLEHFKKSFSQVSPATPLDSIADIRNLLSRYDDRNLTKTFVERAIAKLRATGPDRNFSGLPDWCDGNMNADQPATNLPSHVYLLISVELIAGRLRLIPELYFPDISRLERQLFTWDQSQGKDIDLERSQEEIAALFFAWLEEVEKRVFGELACQKETVSIELFLPYQLLGERIDCWPVVDELGGQYPLGKHRSTMVRSFDRAKIEQLKLKLNEGWSKLQNWLNCSPSDRAAGEWNCAQCLDELEGVLHDSPIVHFPQGLPESPDDRLKVFKTLVKSRAPIALWNHEPNEAISAEINCLLTPDNLQEFAKLSAAIRSERLRRSPLAALGMLCDCPDRWPVLPFPKNPLKNPSQRSA